MANMEISERLFTHLKINADKDGLSINDWLEQTILESDSGQDKALSERKYPQTLINKMLNHIPTMCYIFDRKLGYHSFVNPYAKNFFGLSLSQLQYSDTTFYDETLHPEDKPLLEEHLNRWDAASDEDVFEKEYRLRRADGQYRWFRSYETVVSRDEQGVPHLIGGTAFDITAQKENELELKNSEETYRLLTENAHDVIFRVKLQPELHFDYVSPASTGIVGYTPEEFYADGQLGFKLAHPDDVSLLQQVIEGKLDTTFTLRWKHKDGSIIWTEQKSIHIYDDDGTLVAIEGIARDITERKKVEQALQESEKRFALFMNHFPGHAFIKDADTRVIFANQSLIDFLGYDPTGQVNNEIQPSYRIKEIETIEREILQSAKPVSYETLSKGKGNEEKSMLVIKFPIEQENDIRLIGCLGIDISERKEAEAKQKELIEQYELAINTARLGTGQINLHNNEVTWNSHMYEIYGIKEGEYDGSFESWQGMIHPEDLDYATQKVYDIVTEKQLVGVKYRIVRPNGEVRYIDTSGQAIDNENGEIIKLIGIAIDVTEQEHAKLALQASEARYRALFNGTLNPIVVYDAQGHINLINEVGARNLGTTVQEAVGKSMGDFVPEFGKINLERIQSVLDTQAQMYVEDTVELAEGKRWFWSTIEPIFGDAEIADKVQIVSYEITDRKQAEELENERAGLLLKLEKEHALAEQRSKMISILSHELRTPLAIISTSSELISKYLDRLTPEKREEKVADIRQQIRHLSSLLDDISLLSQADRDYLEYQAASTNIKALCDIVFDKIQAILSSKHSLSLNLHLHNTEAILDEKLMYHALSNLIINAIKYSPKGGAIILDVSQIDNELIFSVKDEGIGIPEEEQKSLFTPFNRASNVGQIRGTGLGLSIVREIAEQHNGSVSVDSQVGKGSTFIITIPIGNEEQA